MALTDAELKKLLLDLSYVSAEDIKKAEAQCKPHGISLKDALTELDLLSQDVYEGAIAEHYHLKYYDIGKNPPAADMVGLLPENIARAYNAMVVARDKSGVTVATADPSNKLLEEAVRLNLEQEIGLFPDKEHADKKQSARK